ncbi:MAG: hypothetical protein JWO71_622 [Candidatus Acidoferrum typicum]|nr:hypothetical protein [Candidatus Acidoferrum typicum]
MDDRKFEVRCNAMPNGHLQVKAQALSVGVGQLIRKDGTEEMWQSVLVICEDDEDGQLTTKVIVCHPDWEQNLQIACIRSGKPESGKPAPALEIDLKSAHV